MIKLNFFIPLLSFLGINSQLVVKVTEEPFGILETLTVFQVLFPGIIFKLQIINHLFDSLTKG